MVEESGMTELKRGLERLAKENGRVSVPAYMHEFFKEHRSLDFESMFSKLLEVVPESMQQPTYNEALMYFNLYKLQTVADRIYASIQKIIEESDDDDDEAQYRLRTLERKFQDVSAMILKYSSMGVDRDTPKSMNVNVNYLDLNSIHQQLRDIKDITPTDDEEHPTEVKE